ncbi:MAG: succinylglutamate desuccinylase/aspartoacylase family protein [Pseudomonadota bacterium]
MAEAFRRETHQLPPTGGRDNLQIEVLKFGEPGARPKVYMQAGLHADELPGMLVLRKLAAALEEASLRGDLLGEVVLVPVCNPIGLTHIAGGYMVGRVDPEAGRNFNRGFPDLAAFAQERLKEPLGDDAEENVAALRKAMRKGVKNLTTDDAFSALQQRLVLEACDADIVLDVHADNEAMLHLYIGEGHWPDAEDLAADLDARAVLLTDESGGATFDECHGNSWARLQRVFPDKPIPLACFAATVELRSNNQVTEEDTDRDCRALFRFLNRRGVVKGEGGALPRLLCEAVSLRAMQQLRSPIEGLVVYRARLGDRVRKGDLIAEIVPTLGGERVAVSAETDGLLFARHDQTWAWPDKVIGKIAGREPLEDRQGYLLTD